jgi:hypothetical protein
VDEGEDLLVCLAEGIDEKKGETNHGASSEWSEISCPGVGESLIECPDQTLCADDNVLRAHPRSHELTSDQARNAAAGELVLL